jgi:hypothetical protein
VSAVRRYCLDHRDTSPAQRGPGGRACVIIAALTLTQLLLGTLSGLAQYDGKGFSYRLVIYPLLMAVAPAGWWWTHRRGHSEPDLSPVPWTAFALLWAPFLIDVTGNTLNLYDTIDPWDNLNHLTNWFLLMLGLGMLAFAAIRPRWTQILLITGTGALLALLWEIGEWFSFIRRGVELTGAYQDTLSDQALGTLGAFCAALFLALSTRGRRGSAELGKGGTRAGGKRSDHGSAERH